MTFSPFYSSFGELIVLNKSILFIIIKINNAFSFILSQETCKCHQFRKSDDIFLLITKF